MSGGVLSCWVRGVGLLGPGLPDWATGRELLADPARWVSAPTMVPAPSRLPPAERRRAGTIVKVGIAVADQACAQAGLDPQDVATVFSASTGDGPNCHALCETLATPQRAVSPTRFTNSVHNAPAGYWHIATASRAPSTSLCAHDASFGAGLLEAASQCLADQRPVLLVASDAPYPQPLQAVRPLADAMGVALLLDTVPGDAPLLRLHIGLGDAAPESCAHAGLESLRLGIPAARALPLLQRMARGAVRPCVLEYLDGLSLTVGVEPA
ncbi:beta-ketoacyl synthase chain length factor [Azohydromonas caseinilytica]|uniref:Beta-ketoacyl synthase chain length factor n=1 Tax=Azohydromonas caseinilytica TaxID=2728836 RepID=A0A848FEA0_9BURK|nr:beta-ketoacyl synthase chain length factor [Azohydromonas caseinilytica]NML18537.1 beta-ketoacyl synthase chain length factor [Azohydromonas caseinilytica]